MKQALSGVPGEAWAVGKADRELLLPLAGLTFFVPLLALLLLMPDMPALTLDPAMGEAAQQMQAQKLAAWIVRYGGWYVLASAIVQFGVLVVLTLYLHDDRPDLGAALARAGRLFPRYLLLTIAASAPLGISQLYVLLIVPALYFMGRWLVAGPVLVSEPPPSLRTAFRRSWGMTRGHGLLATGLAAISVLGSSLVALPFLALDHSLRAAHLANPVVLLLVDAAAAAAAAIAMLAMPLIQIAAYRRLVSSKGI